MGQGGSGVHGLRAGAGRSVPDGRQSDESPGVAPSDEQFERCSDVVGHGLGSGEPAVGVDPDALGVPGEHGDDAVLVTDRVDVVPDAGLRAGRDDVDLGPERAAGGPGPALLIRAAYQRDRGRDDTGVGKECPGSGDVLAGVGRRRLTQDRRGGDAELQGTFAEMDRLPLGESGRWWWARWRR